MTSAVHELPSSQLPEAKYRGVLRVLDAEIPVYVLKDGQRIIGHGGDTQFFHTDFHLFLDGKVGLYVAFNSQGKEGANRDQC